MGFNSGFKGLNKFYLFGEAKARVKINREGKAFYSPNIQKMKYLI